MANDKTEYKCTQCGGDAYIAYVPTTIARGKEDDLHTKVDLENGSPAFAKPVLAAALLHKSK